MTSVDETVADFAACGRCSFFLSAYRVMDSARPLEEVVQDEEDGWLLLTWNLEMRHLLQSSYGNRLDVEFFHIDGRCPECLRRFVYTEPESGGEPMFLRLQRKG